MFRSAGPTALPGAQHTNVPKMSFIARCLLRGAFIALSGGAKVVIHSKFVTDAATCVVLIFCRMTQNIRAARFRSPRFICL